MALLEELPSLEDLLSHQGLERKDLGGRYSADMRLEIIQLFDDWKMRGYYFGFTSQKLNDIKIDNDNEEQRRIALLNAWEQRKGRGHLATSSWLRCFITEGGQTLLRGFVGCSGE